MHVQSWKRSRTTWSSCRTDFGRDSVTAKSTRVREWSPKCFLNRCADRSWMGCGMPEGPRASQKGGGGRQNRTRNPITAAYENPTRRTNRLHNRWERRTTGRWRTVTGQAGTSPGVSRRGPAHSWLRGEHRRPQHVLEKMSLKVVVEGRTAVPGGTGLFPGAHSGRHICS